MKQITLSKGFFSIVDDDDFARISKHNWQISTKGYAVRTFLKKQQGLAYFILNEDPIKGRQLDHINRNKLDNRKENLRFVTQKENLINRGVFKKSTSGYKGVTWCSPRKKWLACVVFNKKTYYLGCFSDVKDAAKAYNDGAIKYHGEYAFLNKI